MDWVAGTFAAVGLGGDAINAVDHGVDTLAGNLATARSTRIIRNDQGSGPGGG